MADTAPLRIVGGGGDGQGPVFPDRFEGGKPKATYRNTRIALTCFGARFSHNLFRRRDIIEWHMIGVDPIEATEEGMDKFRQAIIDKYGFDPKKENVFDALHSLCFENAFDPVCDYLDGLKWDGRARLDSWLTYYLGAADTALNRAFGRKTLIAAVRRARRPGCKFDNILTLEGGQGTGKSTALRILAIEDDAFTDQDLLHLDAKSQKEALAGKWIVELAELAGMRRADSEKVKAFASRTHDRARAAYARFTDDQPRRCIMVGTTNADEYLSDPTGNRRFWPVRTGSIDLEALRCDRDQLWAEAAIMERNGESLMLDSELWGDAASEAAKRLETDPWEDILRRVKGEIVLGADGAEERVMSADLLGSGDYLNVPKERQTTPTAQRLARAMKKLGWQGPDLMRIGGRRGRGYWRKSVGDES
jgi:predicted P-loop ATPase